MKIEGIQNQLNITSKLTDKPVQPNKTGGDFKNVLSSFIDQVQSSNKEAEKLTTDFIMGGDTEIHEVMIAAEKAKTDVMLLSEIKNKALDTYQELLRMQV